MNRALLLMLVAVLLLLWACRDSASQPREGEAAPARQAWQVQELEQVSAEINRLKGKSFPLADSLPLPCLVLLYTQFDCMGCVEKALGLATELHDDADFPVVYLIHAAAEGGHTTEKNLPAMHDPKDVVRRSLGFPHTPMLFLLDQSGAILHAYPPMNYDDKELRLAFLQACEEAGQQ
ncbi:MAG: hypothetical protein D6730_10135 [Bacteroidetes bacterium]|nr:MAG: hypothetical protein D6730_10135 [Bacteroidota bacterium]